MVMSDGTGICYVATCSVVYIFRRYKRGGGGGVKGLLRDMRQSNFNLIDQ